MKIKNKEIVLILVGLIALGIIIYQAAQSREAQDVKKGFEEGYKAHEKDSIK